jgi:hypothetical protein
MNNNRIATIIIIFNQQIHCNKTTLDIVKKYLMHKKKMIMYLIALILKIIVKLIAVALIT